MKTSELELARLFDCYGGLLTEKQQMIFELYHNDDLSLGEIAENLQISRQGVRDALLRAEASLNSFEEKVGCVALEKRLASVAHDLTMISAELTSSYTIRSDPMRLKLMGKQLENLADKLCGK